MRQKNRRTESGRDNKESSRYLYGRHVVEELLAHAPERIVELLVVQRDSAGRLDKIIGDARRSQVELRFVEAQELNSIVESEQHQSVAVRVLEPTYHTLDSVIEELADRERAVLLVLDGIQDPHNFGAALRVAECFGVDAVLWSKNRGVDVTPTVSKVSAGASELVKLCPVSNLHQTLEKLKEHQLWCVGAVVGKGCQSLYSFSFPERCVIVMGSEESGIQPLLAKNLDFSIYIPMQGKIASLNVAQTTAIFLAECNRQSSGRQLA